MRALSYQVLDPTQWPLVQELMARSPMSAAMPLVIERPHPNLESAYPVLKGTNICYVCFDADKLVGYFRVLLAPVMISEDTRLTGYVSDVRIHSDYRGQGILQKFMNMHKQDIIKLGGYGSYCFSNVGNKALETAIAKDRDLQAQILCSFETRAFFLHGIYRSRSFSLTKVLKPQLSQVVALDFKYTFNTQLNEAEWNTFLSQNTEIEFYATSEAPEKVIFALWKTSRYRRYSMHSYPLGISLMQKIWNKTLALYRANPIPSETQEWSIIDICFVDPRLKFKQEWLDFCKLRGCQMGGLMLNCVTSINGVSTMEKSQILPDLAMSIKTELKYFHNKKLYPENLSLSVFNPSINLSLM